MSPATHPGEEFKYAATRSYIQALRLVLINGENNITDARPGAGQGTIADAADRTSRIMRVKLPTYQIPAVKSASGYL